MEQKKSARDEHVSVQLWRTFFAECTFNAVSRHARAPNSDRGANALRLLLQFVLRNSEHQLDTVQLVDF